MTSLTLLLLTPIWEKKSLTLLLGVTKEIISSLSILSLPEGMNTLSSRSMAQTRILVLIMVERFSSNTLLLSVPLARLPISGAGISLSSPGMMVTSDSLAYDPDAVQVTYNNVTYAVIAPGHDYIFSEKDINLFFIRLSEKAPAVSEWSDATIKKLKQVLVRFMIECEYLESPKSQTLLPVYLFEELENTIRCKGDNDALAAFNCLI